MTNTLDKRTDNFLYAPGIATYGVDGKAGETGEKGTAIFYTDYNFTDTSEDNDDLATLLYCIKNHQCLLKAYAGTELSRPYIDGDYLICSSGEIYKLKNVDTISAYTSGMSYNEWMSLVGKVDSTVDDKVYFTLLENGTNDRIINKSDYAGLDIAPTAFEFSDDDGYTLRVGSEVSSSVSDSLAKALALVAQNGLNDAADLKFYYDPATSAWFISSSSPIVIDAPAVKMKDNGSESTAVDNYTEAVTSDTTLTGFYNAAKLCTWTAAGGAVTVSVDGNDKMTQKVAWAAITSGSALMGSIYYANGDHALAEIEDDGLDGDEFIVKFAYDPSQEVSHVALVKYIEVFLKD